MIGVALADSPAGQLVHRLDGILLVSQGRSCQEVADLFGVDRRTVQRWVHSAYLHGLQGLVQRHRGGRPDTLSAAQLQSVQRDLRSLPTALGYAHREWSGKLLALHLRQHHQVEISVRTCQRMIKALCSQTTPFL